MPALQRRDPAADGSLHLCHRYRAPRHVRPAGYFCTACPTVVVDEHLIATGMKEGYRFRAVVGVDHAGEKQPDFFKTWDGHQSIYTLDEDGRVMDLTTDNQLDADPRAKLDTLRSLLKKAGNSFDQQEILLSVRGRRERIIPTPEDGFLG